MKKAVFLLVAAILLFFNSVKTVERKDFKLIVAAANRHMTEAILNKDVGKLMAYYTPEAVCIPEFHNALFGREAIKSYFHQLLDAVHVTTYKKYIFEVRRIENYLVATGAFIEKLNKNGWPGLLYVGRYVEIWKIGDNEALGLVSEILGVEDNINRAELPQSVGLFDSARPFNCRYSRFD